MFYVITEIYIIKKLEKYIHYKRNKINIESRINIVNFFFNFQ